MLKIVTVIGARPQFIKAAAFSRVASGRIQEVLVHTGQHHDANMSRVFFQELKIPSPKYNLGIAGGTHAEMTGKMMMDIERVLEEEKPDAVLVYGDTNSTLAGALAASKLLIPIIHIEAGVRLGTKRNPEEINRILTDHLSSLLFTVTELDYDNLRKEGISSHMYVVGNIMYDSYLYASRQVFDMDQAMFLDLDNSPVRVPRHYYYLTCHRQENTCDDVALTEILTAMESLPFPTVYPVHPRNHERVIRIKNRQRFNHIILLQPVGYFESVNLLNNCEKVVTDSGGLQCEAFFAQKQCVTIFDKVVWQATMVNNRNQLAAPDREDICRKLKKEQIIDSEYQPFGKGDSAELILQHILTSDLQLT